MIQATIGESTISGIFKKIDKLKGKRSVDVIVGGPPCQAYSIAGRARLGKEKIEQDPRNELYKYYILPLDEYYSDERARSLWEKYRINYEKHIK